VSAASLGACGDGEEVSDSDIARLSPRGHPDVPRRDEQLQTARVNLEMQRRAELQRLSVDAGERGSGSRSHLERGRRELVPVRAASPPPDRRCSEETRRRRAASRRRGDGVVDASLITTPRGSQ
jgi:hypothetical protein